MGAEQLPGPLQSIVHELALHATGEVQVVIPLQIKWQLSPAHSIIPWQVLSALHSIVQLDASMQSTATQPLGTLQSTWHGTPAGQTTSAGHIAAASHLNSHTSPLQTPGGKQTAAHAGDAPPAPAAPAAPPVPAVPPLPAAPPAAATAPEPPVLPPTAPAPPAFVPPLSPFPPLPGEELE